MRGHAEATRSRESERASRAPPTAGERALSAHCSRAPLLPSSRCGRRLLCRLGFNGLQCALACDSQPASSSASMASCRSASEMMRLPPLSTRIAASKSSGTAAVKSTCAGATESKDRGQKSSSGRISRPARDDERASTHHGLREAQHVDCLGRLRRWGQQCARRGALNHGRREYSVARGAATQRGRLLLPHEERRRSIMRHAAPSAQSHA